MDTLHARKTAPDSIHEERNRARKVDSLVLVIDAAFDKAKIFSAVDRLFAVENMPPEKWAAAELAAQLKHPASETTRAMVIEHYRQRVMRIDQALAALNKFAAPDRRAPLSQADLRALVEAMNTNPAPRLWSAEFRHEPVCDRFSDGDLQ